MYNSLIPLNHAELKRAARSILDAESFLSKHPNGEAAGLIAEARGLMLTMPISYTQIADPKFIASLNAASATNGAQSKLLNFEEQTARNAKANYVKVFKLAQSVTKAIE